MSSERHIVEARASRAEDTAIHNIELDPCSGECESFAIDQWQFWCTAPDEKNEEYLEYFFDHQPL